MDLRHGLEHRFELEGIRVRITAVLEDERLDTARGQVVIGQFAEDL